MARTPVLDEHEIRFLLEHPKPVSDPEWRSHLLPMSRREFDARGRLDLGDLPSTSPIRGRLHLYARRNLALTVVGDWSVGLIYTDYAENSYRVLRCNGPHPTDHVNTIEGDVIVRTPHVHRLTERYQRLRRPSPDGFAEPTDAYSTIEGALEHLSGLINLHADGRLFL